MSKLTRLSVSLSPEAVSKSRRVAREQRMSVSRLLSGVLERCILTQPDVELAQPLVTLQQSDTAPRESAAKAHGTAPSGATLQQSDTVPRESAAKSHGGTKLVPTTKPAKVWPEPGSSEGKRPHGAIEPDLKAQPGQYGYEFQFLDSFDWCQSCNHNMHACRCPLASEFLPEKRVTLLTRKS